MVEGAPCRKSYTCAEGKRDTYFIRSPNRIEKKKKKRKGKKSKERRVPAFNPFSSMSLRVESSMRSQISVMSMPGLMKF